MSAFVLVAGKPEERTDALEAYAYGTRTATLTLRVTYFGGTVQVWEFPSMLNAEWQADRLASGMYVALPFATLKGVQDRVAEWASF